MCGLLILISNLIYARRPENDIKFEMKEHLNKTSLPSDPSRCNAGQT